MKKYLPVLCLLFIGWQVQAQDLTGIWRGYFITDTYEQYRYEVQIEQKNNTLTGVTYSYLDKRFYGKASFTGHYSTTSQTALVQEIKTIEVRMSLSSVACIQKCQLTYIKSGREEFLEGSFGSVYEKTDTAYGYRKGGNCGGGKMYLRKVPTSDFYVEPFLRNPSPKNPVSPPIAKNDQQKKNPDQDQPTQRTTPERNRNKQGNNTDIASSKPETDSNTSRNNIAELKETPPREIPAPVLRVPNILKTRQNDLVQTILVDTDEVTIRLYDNGEIDDDTISVYLDNKIILEKKRLTASPLTVRLKMDDSNKEKELVMVAENMGRIPPNTSLMIVTAGDKRYEVRITSTEQKNAMVRFKYVKR